MKVFRIQHKVTGKGPYACQSDMGFNLDQVCPQMKSKYTPEPDNDRQLRLNFNGRFPECLTINGSVRGEFVFGFLDEKQLRKWFGNVGIMHLIDDYGFEVVIKDIPQYKVIKGETQCMIYLDAWFESKPLATWSPANPTQIAVA